jgi:hypothetical protein
VIGFRQCDWRWPFLWEDEQQPEARWHGPGEGPVHYFADTPDGAWAELIRHEDIRDPGDLAQIRRNLWAVEIDDVPEMRSRLPASVLTGPPSAYSACQEEARRLREEGQPGLIAPSAALKPGEARGLVADRGLQPGPSRDGQVIVLFGRRPDLVAWIATEGGRPAERLLERVSHF